MASDPVLSDMAWSAGIGRSHFGHRAGVAFRNADSLREGLRAIVEADEGQAAPKATKVAFVYTGQASQWPGMGEALYASEPVCPRECSTAATRCSRRTEAAPCCCST